MFSRSKFAVRGASTLLAVALASPVLAEELPSLEKPESAGPAVDPGASRGADPSIVDQEKANLDGSGPDVDAGASTGASSGESGSERSIVDEEKDGIE